MPLMLMEHTTSAKDATAKIVGDVSDVDVFKNQVLVAIYQRPEKTAAGLFLPDGVRKEDQFQGKVGLVLKKGPDAFVSDGRYTFKDTVEVGDWILFKVSDGWPITLNTANGLCRMIDDVDVRGRVAEPDKVW